MSALIASATTAHQVPPLIWTWPFVAILLAIALLPLIPKTHHWWESNRNKLLISVVLATATLGYYYMRDYGVVSHAGGHDDASHVEESAHGDPHADDHEEHAAESHADEHAAKEDPHAHTDEHGEPHGKTHDVAHDDAHTDGHDAEGHDTGHADAGHDESAHVAHHARTDPGIPTVLAVLDHAILKEFVPFFVLLFALYVIAGGIVVRGDIRATPMANTAILGIGGALASFIGTTGASMVLIRLLLKTNVERKRVVHTVVFFIFIVSNIGGALLPVGDPPLFLGYLKGVPFFWTMGLVAHWAFLLIALLFVYYLWDTWAYKHESKADIKLDDTQTEPIRIAGLHNLIWLIGVVFAVATLDPGKPFPGTEWHPFPYLREGIQLALVGVSLVLTKKALRVENQFNYVAIMEVACLFIGIFITMQVPIEILNVRGAQLGLSDAWQFFWATGVLSSFLDNAPTYVVFFETAKTLTDGAGPGIMTLPGDGHLRLTHLTAISCGAVFMGANSYIGNGPNFMVKTIAEQAGVRMPSFFGYMAYSTIVLVPLFIVLTLIFFR